MAYGMESVLGRQVDHGLISGYLNDEVIGRYPLKGDWKLFYGGHPLPNSESFRAGEEALELLHDANLVENLVVFLISGGGSAMIEKGVGGVSDDDIVEANRVLVACGADIAEVNAVRKCFSAIKGGKLAVACGNAAQITLIVSDTEPGDAAAVASGPSIIDDNSGMTAAAVLDKHLLLDRLPSSIVASVQNAATDLIAEPANRTIRTILDNAHVLKACAESAKTLGFETFVDEDLRQNEVADGVGKILERAKQMLSESSANSLCLISGGEFSCPVRGDGTGGRNAETALWMALDLDREETFGAAAFASVGTDGIDGNSPAAGAICDEQTISRSIEAGISAEEHLMNSDAYSFFNALGDAIVTGPTLTNVRDIRVLLITK